MGRKRKKENKIENKGGEGKKRKERKKMKGEKKKRKKENVRRLGFYIYFLR